MSPRFSPAFLLKILLAALAALLLLLAATAFAPFAADAKEETTKPVAREQPSESQLLEHRHYTNKSGTSVHSPAHTKDDKKPKGATAKCRDGTWSFSQNHR